MDQAGKYIADAVLGIDTLWGGDVMCPSGTGRFIADSWFSDEPLPAAYTHPAAARLRQSGGVAGKSIDREAVEEYLRAVDLPKAIAGVRAEANKARRPAPALSDRPRRSLETMWDLAMEVLGKGDPVPYTRAVEASTGKPPEPSIPQPNASAWPNCWPAPASPRRMPANCSTPSMHGAASTSFPWPRCAPSARPSSPTSTISARKICSPIFPPTLRRPAANIDFLPIKDAWFSGSMNYLGRARNADGSPQYEATYEINASLQMSYPEFEQLVSHEVVPGHVTTFAYLQDLYVRGKAGFEATVLTMNTRAATLFEGIANNAILIAHGVTGVDQLPDEDLQIGVLLALCRTTPRISRPISPGARAARSRKSPRPCATISWSRQSAPISSPAHGDAIHCWPHVSPGLPLRHGKSRGVTPHLPSRPRASGHLRLQWPAWTSKPSTRYCEASGASVKLMHKYWVPLAGLAFETWETTKSAVAFAPLTLRPTNHRAKP